MKPFAFEQFWKGFLTLFIIIGITCLLTETVESAAVGSPENDKNLTPTPGTQSPNEVDTSDKNTENLTKPKNHIQEKRNVAHHAMTQSRLMENDDLLDNDLEKRNMAYVARMRSLYPNRFDKKNVAYYAKLRSYVPKRNMAYFAQLKSRQMEDPGFAEQKRNVANFARWKSRNLVDDLYNPVDDIEYNGYQKRSEDNENDDDLDEYDTPEKRYFGSLLGSSNPPRSYVSMDKRHLSALFDSESPYRTNKAKRFYGSLLDSEDPYNSDKRSYASLLNSNNPYRSGKRSFASLLDSNSPYQSSKRSYASILDSDSPYRSGKRSYASLMDSDSPYRSGKRSYASLLNANNPYQSGKRSYGSMLDSDDPYQPGKRSYASILDSDSPYRPDKKSYASLLNSDSPYMPKRFYGSLLDSGDPYTTDKRSYASLLDSDYSPNSLYTTPGKRHFSSLLKSNYAPRQFFASSGKRINSYDKYSDFSNVNKRSVSNDEDDDDEPIQKRYVASLLKSEEAPRAFFARQTRSIDEENHENVDTIDNIHHDTEDFHENAIQKRNIASLLKSRDVPYFIAENRFKRDSDDESIDSEQDAEKRSISSLLKSNSAYAQLYPGGKRSYQSLMQSSDFPFVSDVDKRHFSSLHKSSSFYDRNGKRNLGSLFKSQNTPSQFYSGKRSYASLLKGDNANDAFFANGKRHFGSLLKSDAFYGGNDKRYVSSLLKSGRFNDAFLGNSDKRSDEDEYFNQGEDYIPISSDNYPPTAIWYPDEPEDKRSFASLLKSDRAGDSFYSKNKRYFGDDLYVPGPEEDKRNYASLMNRQNSFQRGYSGKRYYSSLLDNRDKKDIVEDTEAEAEQSDSTNSTRAKRYIGTIARNSNYPLVQNKHVRREATNENFEDYIRELLEEQLKLTLLKEIENAEESEDEYQNIPQKRFLGSVARHSWFPRRYRSYGEGRTPEYSNYDWDSRIFS